MGELEISLIASGERKHMKQKSEIQETNSAIIVMVYIKFQGRTVDFKLKSQWLACSPLALHFLFKPQLQSHQVWDSLVRA